MLTSSLSISVYKLIFSVESDKIKVTLFKKKKNQLSLHLMYIRQTGLACHSCAESINKMIVLHTTGAIIWQPADNLPQTMRRGETDIFCSLEQCSTFILRSTYIKTQRPNNQNTNLLKPVDKSSGPLPKVGASEKSSNKIRHNLPEGRGFDETRSIKQKIRARSGYFQMKRELLPAFQHSRRLVVAVEFAGVLFVCTDISPQVRSWPGVVAWQLKKQLDFLFWFQLDFQNK